MNIRFIEEYEIFRIDTQNSTYCIGITDTEKFLTHIYYGKALGEDDLRYLLRTEEAPFVPSINGRDRNSFLDSTFMEYPGYGAGDFRDTPVCIKDCNGHSVAAFFYSSYRIFAGKKKLEGLPATFGEDRDCMSLEIVLTDPVLKLDCVLSYSVFEGLDAIVRNARIINNSSDSVSLTAAMSACIDIDPAQDDYDMITLNGAWARERHIERRPVGYGRQSIQSIRGESSHQDNPFMALVTEGTDQENGTVYAFNLVYSGNFEAQVEKSQFGSLRAMIGINPTGFQYEIEKGGSFQTPEAVCVFSDKGLGRMTRTFHDLYRRHLIRSKFKDMQRPVLINNWEATYFDFDSEKLVSIARKAHEYGIEMLVMDDGWFGHRNDDNSSLGDWFVNENKIKGGLKKLVDEVTSIGMKFGIWFEPEMISADSELYGKHPEWAIAVPGRKPCLSRNQYVLDFSRKDVRDYIYNLISGILHSADISYVKWDMNRQLTDLGSSTLGRNNQGELSHRYTLGVYELQERLINEFPDLLLENCSGGGARFDPGMLYYSPQIWCSDDTDAIERLSIQEGTAMVYPLSTMGAHVSDCPNHTVGRVTPFKTRGDCALAGTFGYELDITKISDRDRQEIPGQVATYHKYNDLIRNGDYYRIASFHENNLFDCYCISAKDGSEALVTYVQVVGRPNVHSRRVCIPGLDEEALYEIEGTEQFMHGRTIMNAGLLMPVMSGDNESILIHLIKRKKED